MQFLFAVSICVILGFMETYLVMIREDLKVPDSLIEGEGRGFVLTHTHTHLSRRNLQAASCVKRNVALNLTFLH